MLARSVRFRRFGILYGIATLWACASSNSGEPETSDGPVRSSDSSGALDQVSSDSLPPADAAIDQRPQDSPVSLGAGADTGNSDSPGSTMDSPFAVADVAPGSDGESAGIDGRYTTSPDGRQFLLVDYCLPILPLANGSRYCPITLDEAIASSRPGLDGGLPGAHPTIDRCLEPVVVYSPYGPSLGWGEACYYDSQSRQLISVTTGTDTPEECVGSPMPNTAAYVSSVYGQLVKCSWLGQIAVDAGVDR